MDAQLKKGLLEICVLKALENGESYGYKIISDLTDVIVISESTLYPILKRLEGLGMVTSYSREYNGRLRRYYSITRSGEARIREFINGTDEFERIMKFITGERI